ncbi:radical SAM family heme chaperone HemW [Pontimicrobium aquaticum]|uniref:Heme chaperone HemW n=1 Tax=Pontimicrobium aquaticum TaxID=2565367 RepID=A0A4U0F0Y4_9FLAO|nr:radical SAM family heme chaperone HemW [Pontimicrobium aquaticum]TJY37898.1 radical SAM family heme chaperone HemW [Pontimicrobium aquaticum]
MENIKISDYLSNNSSPLGKLDGAAIYIHIPFCKQACHYCDFHFSTSLKKKEELINALIKELELRKEEFQNQSIETIYFGGGTPSLLTNEELSLLINAVYTNYQVVDNPEITLEANPDDLTEKRVKELANSQINRLSIGIQSFFEDDLKSMNRAHNATEAKECLKEATRYFDNITIDLIYGIPNMSLEKWNENLKIAFNFGVNHISSYALTVEPKTALDSFIKKGTYPPIDEELALEHFNHLIAETDKQGFVHYEISNFGKPNYFSKHNTSYWQGKSYLGIGPSAHSFYNNQRSWNIANNTKYIKSIQQNQLPSTVETLTKKNRFNECVMTGLRTIWGVSLLKIEEDFGSEFKEHLLTASKEFINQQLLIVTSSDCDSNCIEKLQATQKGKFLIDGISSSLFLL